MTEVQTATVDAVGGEWGTLTIYHPECALGLTTLKKNSAIVEISEKQFTESIKPTVTSTLSEIFREILLIIKIFPTLCKIQQM